MIKLLSSFIICLLTILGYFPIKTRRILASIVAKILYFTSKKETQISIYQYKAILKIKEAEAIAKTKQVYLQNSITALEALNLWPILKQSQKYIEVDNPQLFEKYLNSKRPTIALSAHTSNWELLAAYLVKRGFPLIAIGKQMRNQLAQNLLLWLRSKHKVTTAWRGDISEAKELRRKLKNGEMLGGLIDQDIKLKGIMSKFLGANCKTASTLIDLGLKANCNFVTVFIFRTSSTKFKVFFSEIKSRDPQAIIDEYHLTLGNLIKEYPTQWVWFHKRWRSPNLTETMSTEEYLKFLQNMN